MKSHPRRIVNRAPLQTRSNTIHNDDDNSIAASISSLKYCNTGSTDDSSVSGASVGSYRFERLHEYGTAKAQQRINIDKMQKDKKSTREINMKKALEKKQMRQRREVVGQLPPREKIGSRIHDSYSQRKNDAGRKLREEIARRNAERAAQRQAGWK